MSWQVTGFLGCIRSVLANSPKRWVTWSITKGIGLTKADVIQAGFGIFCHNMDGARGRGDHRCNTSHQHGGCLAIPPVCRDGAKVRRIHATFSCLNADPERMNLLIHVPVMTE